MRSFTSILAALFCFSALLSAQSNPNINLGDTYSEVISKIESDPLRQNYNVLKKEGKITVYVRPGSALQDLSVNEYHFKKAVLVKKIITMNVPDPDAALAWHYRFTTQANGKPTVVKRNGQKAYRWKVAKTGRTMYAYLTFSDWYQKKCVVIENE